MIRRFVHLLIAVPILLLPALVATPAAAAERRCWTSLGTGYGPVWVCTLSSGNNGRAALYSPLTGQYSYQSGWIRSGVEISNSGMVTATDGYRGYFMGGSGLATGYGTASFGAQYQGPNTAASKARYGWYNLLTLQFHPSSGWLNAGA
ncbi:hypothetical protein [Micromonospora lutea]|uniref:Uncharacterized protein n=1 Tax=Micromonospora lutea TaxID=419825 RepID=A0ABQ4ISI6_9ACTN|nr:hypothetical protein [Micromonospora lutea]GIJ20852.1 hypothetical protein Vlu01_14760 [Micromonospora lutea]